MNIEEYINHSRDFGYMSGIERDKIRLKETAEVFTPTDKVQVVLDDFEKHDSKIFLDVDKTFLDPSCGDGQILTEIVIRKLQRSKCTLEQVLLSIYGVDLMEDNIKICKERLGGPNPTQEILEILDKNIVCHDALTYDYSFGEPVGMEKYY
tara:strand:+ start:82 stop:534 length:453 start_codon:yes stop_codon:yes gene_type:complete